MSLTITQRPPERGSHGGWHRVPLASLDLETTGIDPHHDRILSYALLGGGAGPGAADDTEGADVELSGFVDPGIAIPAESAEVHGISTAMLAGAPPTAEALAMIVGWIQSLVQRRVGLVVFNASYDLTMLRAEVTRHGLQQPDWLRLLVVDPFLLDWSIEREGVRPRRLVDVAAFYGVPMGQAHNATCDAWAAREVAVELAARHAHVGTSTLDELMLHQRTWYAERAHVWNSSARREGRPPDDPFGWPLALGPA